MRIARLDLVHVTVPMVVPFASAHSARNDRRLFLLRVESSDGVVGWGECAAEEHAGYSSETLAVSATVIKELIGPNLAALENTGALGDALRNLTASHFATAAVFQAVLDAELRDSGVSLAAMLGITNDHVRSGVVVGLQEDMNTTLELMQSYAEQGYARIKFKIEPGRDAALLKAVRERLGADAVLQVDANGAYSRNDIPLLLALDEFGLAMIEQPLPANDIDGSVELAKQMRTPICLDEGIVDCASAAAALDEGVGAIINIKPGRVGGIDEAVRMHDLCIEHGAGCWIGGMLETGVGRAANIVLSALPGCTHPGDVSPSSRYFETDLTEPFVMKDGKIAVPSEPGASRHPIADVLSFYGATYERVI